MRRFILFTSCLLASMNLLMTAAQAQGDKVAIPERTEIKVVLMQNLKSGDSKEDSEVPFEVKQDVIEAGTGTVLVKAGTPAFGKVLVSKKRGMFGKPGKIDFSCEYILMPDLTRVPLRSKVESAYGKDNRGASVATAVLLAPIALLVQGRDVTINKGETYTFFVDKTISAGTRSVTAGGGGSADAAGSHGTASGVQWIFLTRNNDALIGSFLGLDGAVVHIATSTGKKSLKLSEVKSIVSDKSGGVPVEKSVFLLQDGTAMMGILLSFDGEKFITVSDAGQKSIRASDIKSISMIKS